VSRSHDERLRLPRPRHRAGGALSLVDDRSYTPPDALLPDYRHMLKTIGIQRSVLVQPSMHGADNT
jgi:predicted TIM-barrel fold metal-dependent hydrolase